MTETGRERMIAVLREIQADMDRDTAEMEGKPFTGAVVAGAFGELRATVQALARIVEYVLVSEAPETPPTVTPASAPMIGEEAANRLSVEVRHRNTGGVRFLVRDEAGVTIAELLLDSAPLAVSAFEAFAVALNGGIDHGVLYRHGPVERVDLCANESAARDLLELSQGRPGRTAELVRRAVGPWLTENERATGRDEPGGTR